MPQLHRSPGLGMTWVVRCLYCAITYHRWMGSSLPSFLPSKNTTGNGPTWRNTPKKDTHLLPPSQNTLSFSPSLPKHHGAVRETQVAHQNPCQLFTLLDGEHTRRRTGPHRSVWTGSDEGHRTSVVQEAQPHFTIKKRSDLESSSQLAQQCLRSLVSFNLKPIIDLRPSLRSIRPPNERSCRDRPAPRVGASLGLSKRRKTTKTSHGSGSNDSD